MIPLTQLIRVPILQVSSQTLVSKAIHSLPSRAGNLPVNPEPLGSWINSSHWLTKALQSQIGPVLGGWAVQGGWEGVGGVGVSLVSKKLQKLLWGELGTEQRRPHKCYLCTPWMGLQVVPMAMESWEPTGLPDSKSLATVRRGQRF